MSEAFSITVDPTAVDRIRVLRQKDGHSPRTLLRIAVNGGGCSGFQYDITLTDITGADDIIYADAVVIDKTSLGIMDGSRIGFRDDLTGAQFTIDNPRATSGCGCGSSFAVEAL